jgi:hypothetical protein
VEWRTTKHGAFPEFRVFTKLNTPAKIQDFLDGFHINFEKKGETCRSPLEVLRHKEAHCMEGAMLAAAVLWYNGHAPLLLDLKVAKKPHYDDDHAVALFRKKIPGFGFRWGAISKTNHAVLRYRDPVYANVRELAMSYFNEYFLDNGVKTLRSYSKPIDMRHFGMEWLTSRKDLFNIPNSFDKMPHTNILPKSAVKNLRRADPLEIKAGKLVGQKRSR